MDRLRYGSLVLVTFMIAACGTVATPEWSQAAQGTRAALASTAEQQTANAPTATPTSTLTSTPLPTSTPTSIPPTALPTTELPTATAVEATPEAPVAVVAAGDPAHGEQLFHTFFEAAQYPQGCATCHLTNSEDRLIGPGLLNVETRAAARVPGMSADDYIHTSIVNPSAFVVPDYPDNLMPKVYGEILSEQDISDLIAYLKTLKS